jgi:hypothetical protein
LMGECPPAVLLLLLMVRSPLFSALHDPLLLQQGFNYEATVLYLFYPPLPASTLAGRPPLAPAGTISEFLGGLTVLPQRIFLVGRGPACFDSLPAANGEKVGASGQVPGSDAKASHTALDVAHAQAQGCWMPCLQPTRGPSLAMDESASHLVTAATRHGQGRTLVDKDERRNISSAESWIPKSASTAAQRCSQSRYRRYSSSKYSCVPSARSAHRGVRCTTADKFGLQLSEAALIIATWRRRLSAPPSSRYGYFHFWKHYRQIDAVGADQQLLRRMSTPR